MMRLSAMLVLVLFVLVGFTRSSDAHCQIPCGIYDDAARVKMIREDIVTITKSVKEIGALAGKRDAQSANQLTRWVMNKEHHAEKIIRTISDYFMAQKIKPVGSKDKKAAAYLESLSRHHAVMVGAMKCKQSASMEDVKALAKAVDAIAGYWK